MLVQPYNPPPRAARSHNNDIFIITMSSRCHHTPAHDQLLRSCPAISACTCTQRVAAVRIGSHHRLINIAMQGRLAWHAPYRVIVRVVLSLSHPLQTMSCRDTHTRARGRGGLFCLHRSKSEEAHVSMYPISITIGASRPPRVNSTKCNRIRLEIICLPLVVN